MWAELKNKVEALRAYREMERKLVPEGADVSVSGASGGARALLLATLAAKIDLPMLVIAPGQVKARDFGSDLASFGLDGVVTFPDDEILPYDYQDPDRSITGLQMKALDELIMNECRILVCTIRSALKKVFAPSLFRSLLIHIESGSERDPQELAARIAHLGYERHQIVEAKGQFALRGGILDIFEVCEDVPVRMEFDGDMICSMREFDIETQRSLIDRSAIRVRPLHRMAPDEEGIDGMRDRLAERAKGLEGEELEKAMMPVKRLEEGIAFFGMEHYAPDVHGLMPVTSYFGKDPLVVLLDAEEIEKDTDDFRREIERMFDRSREEGNLYPPPDDMYVCRIDMQRWMSARRLLRFFSVEWGGSLRFGCGGTGDYRRNLDGLVSDIRKELGAGNRIFIFCINEIQRERAVELLEEVEIDVDFLVGWLSKGFKWPDLGAFFLSDEEIFGRYHMPYRAARTRSRSLTYDPSHFKPGDLIVHVDHGIGRYMGMRILDVEGGMTECLDIRYSGDDRLFIPVARLRMVERYLAADGTEPPIDRLGSRAWTRAREKARKSAGKVAKDLVEIYAKRQIASGCACEADKPWQLEMEASFQYEETSQQLQATEEVKRDLESTRPMDRLLCGDVGFGKTEVAIRAAFKVVLCGKCCAFLVPTTVLAMQHFNTIRERLQGFPVNVAMLSRFVPPSRQKRIVEQIAAGGVDIVVGTHRLLSKDVSFKSLGLVVIDEEHRFGVKQKEEFKRIKSNVDVLSMTATPIPRTLSMAMSGLREISVIDTPPRNRLPIHTEIMPFDDELIREAIMREVGRGGQVFFVHNRVRSVGVMEDFLRRLLPESVRVAHAHGQMNERGLERRMVDFLQRRFDVLVCTMIIEAGLDFPNVNTIIIDRADKFGLAQLYQLRGRVGRSDRKAYAFLLVPDGRAPTDEAVQRLQAISEFDYLGAGYRIAMRDLEIRGAGNLLGHQQSGQIKAVGLDLYTRMLKEEIARLKGEPVAEPMRTKVSLPLPAYIPGRYISDSEERMDIYRRLSNIEGAGDVTDMADELVDRFGQVPEPAMNMLKIVEIKLRAQETGVEVVEASGNGELRIAFERERIPGKKVVAGIAETFTGRLTFHAGEGLVLSISAPDQRGGRAGISQRGAAWMVSDLESLLNLLELYDK